MIRRRIQELYQNQDFQGALDLAEQHADDFPEHAPIFYYWRMNFAAHLEEYGTTLRLFEEFLISGRWFGETLLRSNPAFSDLQGAPQFESLVQKNLEIAEADLDRDFPLLNIRPRDRCGNADDPCPILLVLHDNGGSPAQILPFWQPAAQFGWIVAAPRSSQAMWKNAFVWDNLSFAVHEIEEHLITLQEKYAIDAERIVLAGSGTGAETAIYYSLTHSDQIAGFIALNPAGSLSETPSNWDQPIHIALEKFGSLSGIMAGLILLGQDEIPLPLENYRTLQNKLTASGVNCALEIVEDASYDDLSAYIQYIVGALDSF